MPVFNPPLRDFVFQEFEIERNRRNFVLVSVFPFVLSVCVCTLVPDIIVVWNLLGTTIYNFNGYILPMLLKLYHLKNSKKPYTGFVVGIGLCVLGMLFHLIYSGLCSIFDEY